MAIDKLNFSGAGSSGNGSRDFETPIGSLSDRLMKYGTLMVSQGNEDERLKLQQEKDAYQKGRDTIIDNRYNEQQIKTDAEKARLIGKEQNTANAMQAIYNPDEYKTLRLSGEQKAIDETLASADPILRSQIQSELKAYNPTDSAQGWVNTALSQSNVDSAKLADLRMDMDKQRIQQEQFDENKRLQAEQNRISASNSAESNRLKSRELDIQENKINAPTKEDVKAAEERKGYVKMFNDLELKYDPTLTNNQLADVLKEKKKEFADVKKEQKDLRESGIFIAKPTETVQAQRNKFLADSLSGSEGTTYKGISEEIKNDQDKLDRFLLNAKIKLGKNYSDRDVLNMIANERKNQSISAPWDSGLQDSIEAVSEQLGLSETDF